LGSKLKSRRSELAIDTEFYVAAMAFTDQTDGAVISACEHDAKARELTELGRRGIDIEFKNTFIQEPSPPPFTSVKSRVLSYFQ